MAGADIVNVASLLLQDGVGKITELTRRHRRLDGRTRIRVGGADEGQPEPAEVRRAGRLRAGQLHEGVG